MPSYCHISSIWKLIQRCVHPFYSAAVLQGSCQHTLITLFHLTPEASTEAARKALDVTRSIPPGNLPSLPHQHIIMCSTFPPQSHVQTLTCTLRVTSHTGTCQAALCSLSENCDRFTCLCRWLPATFYLPLPQSSRIQIGSDIAIVNSITERGSLAQIYARELTKC